MKIKNPLTVSSHISIPGTVTEDAREHFYQETLVLLFHWFEGMDMQYFWTLWYVSAHFHSQTISLPSFYHTRTIPLGTIKAAQTVVLNKDSVVATQRKLMWTAWSSTSNWIWLRWETYTLKVVFVEHHTHFYVYVSQRSQIQFEDQDHDVYISFKYCHWGLKWHSSLFGNNRKLVRVFAVI